jgi:hypothetical protein
MDFTYTLSPQNDFATDMGPIFVAAKQRPQSYRRDNRNDPKRPPRAKSHQFIKVALTSRQTSERHRTVIKAATVYQCLSIVH